MDERGLVDPPEVDLEYGGGGDGDDDGWNISVSIVGGGSTYINANVLVDQPEPDPVAIAQALITAVNGASSMLNMETWMAVHHEYTAYARGLNE